MRGWSREKSLQSPPFYSVGTRPLANAGCAQKAAEIPRHRLDVRLRRPGKHEVAERIDKIDAICAAGQRRRRPDTHRREVGVFGKERWSRRGSAADEPHAHDALAL